MSERTVDAFINGLRRQDFIEEMGRINQNKVSKLMDIANMFVHGEDTYNNKRTLSPKDDHSNRYNSQKHRSQNYDGYSRHSQVAEGFMNNKNNQGDEHRSGGHRNDNRDESGPNRPYRPWTSRDYNESPQRYPEWTLQHALLLWSQREEGIQSPDERLLHFSEITRSLWHKASRSTKSRVRRNPRVNSIQRTAASSDAS
jgi:hypothetical protein